MKKLFKGVDKQITVLFLSLLISSPASASYFFSDFNYSDPTGAATAGITVFGVLFAPFWAPLLAAGGM